MASAGKLCNGGPWHRWALAVLTLITTGSGCGTANHYQITIEPNAEGFVRRVEVASNPQPSQPTSADEAPAAVMSEEEHQVFRAIYGVGDAASESVRFEGDFTDQTPDDVGGVGALVRISSELGDLFVYQERFRGGLPTQRERLTRQAAIDQLIQWTLDWLDEELTTLEGADAVWRFVDHQFRSDLQDLVCLLEVTGARPPAADSASDSAPTLLLIGHFLVDRGYVSIGELTQLPLLEMSEDEGLRWATERLRRKIATASGLALDAPALQILDNPAEIPKRFERFLGQTAQYRQWRDQRQSDPQAKTSVSEFAGETLSPVVGPLFVGLIDWNGPDQLTLVLRTAAEPMETNGKWDSDAGEVRWDWRLPPRTDPQRDASWLDVGLPQVAFAMWAHPNVEKQTAVFGEVLLRDRSLRAYCRWRGSLQSEQAARWTELLEQLPELPGEQRSERLLQFDPAWSDTEEIPGVIRLLSKKLSAANDPSRND